MRKTRKRYVLYSDKTWAFDQSDCLQGPIYINNVCNKTVIGANLFSFSHDLIMTAVILNLVLFK